MKALKLVYTGIGSRITPKEIQDEMTEIARELCIEGWTLRSGGATGADKAFESGVKHDRKEIFPVGYQFTEKSWNLVKSVHPDIDAALKYKSVLGRNPFQVFGKDLDDPSWFVVCWTPKGKLIGGTAVNIRLAKIAGIRVFNLYNCFKDDVMDYAEELKQNIECSINIL